MATKTIPSELPPCKNCGGTDRNYRGDCLPCKRTKGREYYYKKNADKPRRVFRTVEERQQYMREYLKRYYADNKQRILQVNREWAVNNPDIVKAARKRWAESNPEKQRKAIARWNEQNADRAAKNRRRWNKANSALKNTYTMNRKHSMRGKLSSDIVVVLMDKQQGKCACCGEPLSNGFHIDHIRPISKGGANVDSNVQLLTPRCNLKKGAKWQEI